METNLEARVAELAREYLPIAVQLLKDVIRIPADYVDRPVEAGGDPSCGLSNHEGPRLELLRRRIIELGAVDSPDDVGFDRYGNLWWKVEDPDDGVAPADKTVVWLDGHTDTVKALRHQWRESIGGIDAYDGVVDAGTVNREFLRGELGTLPPDDEWHHLVFGRGSADQLSGVVCQVLATKIARELRPLGALRGAVIWSYGTAAEEDNDGAGPMYLVRQELPGAPERVPDAVILSEGTGDSRYGAVGIYRGQRGRMQIEVEVTGRSCHGSMPWEGRNPLEAGGRILAEAADAYDRREGFLDNDFLGHGTRTASWCKLDTPSDCAVPHRFTFRFDRRLTVGETPEQAVADVAGLPAVLRAREAGFEVDVRVPLYDEPTWRGYRPGNAQIYPGWMTPADHPAILAAEDTYRRVCTPLVEVEGGPGGLRREPRVSRWIFSTDGVGFPIPVEDESVAVPPSKRWVTSGAFKHPAMFGVGPGIEQNTHKIGECVDSREMALAIAFMARFPSLFHASR
ncbi:MAG: hypothetical protein AMXMBFR64_43960 [Myxococcales bacterium]